MHMEYTVCPYATFRKGKLWDSFYPLSKNPFGGLFSFLTFKIAYDVYFPLILFA